MPNPAPRDSAVNERLIHLRELWVQLQHAPDKKERDRLEQLIRTAAEAYKRATGHDFDN